MEAVIIVFILIVIGLQVLFFVKNLRRMKEYGAIFTFPESWQLRRNDSTRIVDGVFGTGNSIFYDIVLSINKYLGNNSGSVIDFGLLKDAVDRHCDSVEDDIAAQTPIPLYCGLAGTMAGVIFGLVGLLDADAIMNLLGSTGSGVNEASTTAAGGIEALLEGVMLAMIASIIGIILTTANSLMFKQQKLKMESGKNAFLAWMQARLLPELPSDTSQALNNLVKNLNRFNNTFAQNTSNLGDALRNVNESYRIQADIIQAVHDMDVMKMAQANVRVLNELKQCTDKLELFNTYLAEIEGYTDAIHQFEAQFRSEADRIHVLEEIRDFFGRHKGEIAKTMAEADDALSQSLASIRESTSESVEDLKMRFVEQSEQLKTVLNEEREAFTEFAAALRAQFSDQMAQMPELARQLSEIAAIPARLDRLIDKVERANVQLAADITKSVGQTVRQALSASAQNGPGAGSGPSAPASPAGAMPGWMRASGWLALVVIALACVFNVVVAFFPLDSWWRKPQPQPVKPSVYVPAPQPKIAVKVEPKAVAADTVAHADTAVSVVPADGTAEKPASVTLEK